MERTYIPFVVCDSCTNTIEGERVKLDSGFVSQAISDACQALRLAQGWVRFAQNDMCPTCLKQFQDFIKHKNPQPPRASTGAPGFELSIGSYGSNGIPYGEPGHSCGGCGVNHDTCPECGTTHGDSHSTNCRWR